MSCTYSTGHCKNPVKRGNKRLCDVHAQQRAIISKRHRWSKKSKEHTQRIRSPLMDARIMQCLSHCIGRMRFPHTFLTWQDSVCCGNWSDWKRFAHEYGDSGVRKTNKALDESYGTVEYLHHRYDVPKHALSNIDEWLTHQGSSTLYPLPLIRTYMQQKQQRRPKIMFSVRSLVLTVKQEDMLLSDLWYHTLQSDREFHALVCRQMDLFRAQHPTSYEDRLTGVNSFNVVDWMACVAKQLKHDVMLQRLRKIKKDYEETLKNLRAKG